MLHEWGVIPALIGFIVAFLAIPGIIIFAAVRFFGRRDADRQFEKNLPSIIADDSTTQ